MDNIYKKGENRKQQMFFPPSIDEYIGEDNQARAIDDYVELLDMVKLGFKGPIPISGGIWNFYSRYVPDGKIGKHWHISKKPPALSWL